MNNMKKLQQDLYEITGLAYFKSEELITLCPKCEKDRFKSNRSHGHIYISIKDPIFKCFRCDFKGFISKLLYCFDLKFEDYFDGNITFNWSKTDSDKFIDKEINKKIIIPEQNIKDFSYKLKYLKSRIPNYKTHLESNDIIFDIKEFIQSNKLNINQDDVFIDFLNKNFIGFVTTRKSQIICRNIDETSEFRYYKIKLTDIYFKDFYSKRFDSINNKIVMCEGIFDLFNIIENNSTKSIIKGSSIISTALNNDYLKTLISTLDFVRIPYADVIIFSDSNMSEDSYMPIYFNNSVKSLTLYYNTLDKDFGTQNIEPTKIPIKRYLKKR